MSRKKKTSTRRSHAIMAKLGLLTGIILLSYPIVAGYITQEQSNDIITSYSAIMNGNLDQVEYLYQQANAYNDRIATEANSVTNTKNSDGSIPDTSILPYNEQLVINGDTAECFAWVRLPTLNEQLPIYHGTTDDTLQAGVGHLEGSSLPVGGNNTHSVLTAHSGMPGARMFDDIKNLQQGDPILINILDKTLTYRVTYSETVLPEEVESLDIQTGKDMITLITCTPYGINTHRLLVHAERDAENPMTGTLPGELSNDIINARTLPFIASIAATVTFTSGYLTASEIVKRHKRKRRKEVQ